ncbi:MAG: cysteine desulfurase [Clostridiales bacterium]|nr:cysteine desulfurase [Clostridiales bacterium]
MSSFIYADNAATTRISDEVLEAMLPYLQEQYGNASALYRLGRTAHSALEQSRRQIAELLGASPMELFFTSGGTESNNWALKGTVHRLARQGKRHIVTSAVEHHSVLHAAAALEREGVSVTYLPVDAVGRVSPQAVESALRPDTALVSIMYANNEIGTIQPVAEIGAVCHAHGVLFHTDAVQAAGTLPIRVKEQNIDLLSLSAHKFYGPKGVGLLYCRRDAYPATLLDGGAQERGHRAGTENVALAVGMAKALELACQDRAAKNGAIAALRDEVQEGLLRIHDSRLNGDPDHRLPGTLNVSFAGVDGQSLLFRLDLAGLAASSGSACASGSLSPSHVLLALGVPYELAHGSLRISLGKYNTKEDASAIVRIVTDTVAELRGEPSPYR